MPRDADPRDQCTGSVLGAEKRSAALNGDGMLELHYPLCRQSEYHSCLSPVRKVPGSNTEAAILILNKTGNAYIMLKLVRVTMVAVGKQLIFRIPNMCL